MTQHSPLQAGSLFAGRYAIERPLRSGGGNTMYAARDSGTGQPCCLKLLDARIAIDDDMARQFEETGNRVLKLDAPNLVRILDYGIADDSSGIRRPWVVMERLLDGQDLESAARVLPVRMEEIPTILEQVCHGLQALHTANLVHGNLKPRNLYLIRPAGQKQVVVKLLGFGLSRLSALARSSEDGGIATPIWMAPEQSQPAEMLTPSVDVWSLGLLAFYLLTRSYYWIAANQSIETGGPSALSVLNEVLAKPLPNASERASEYKIEHRIPEGFDAWFARCVNRQIERRFPDAAAALQGLLSIKFQASRVGERLVHMAAEHSGPNPSSRPNQRSNLSVVRSAPRGPVQRWLVAIFCGLLALFAGGIWQLIGFVRLRVDRSLCEHTPSSELELQRRGEACGRVCQAGSAPQCLPFGNWMIEKRPLGDQSSVAALDAFTRACRGKLADGCWKAGQLVDTEQPLRGIVTDTQQARQMFSSACELLDNRACVRAGRMAQQGLGGGIAPQVAGHFLGRACDAGDLAVCIELGRSLLRAQGFPLDELAAANRFNQACNRGSAAGCLELANLYQQGVGVARDPARALTLRRRACDQGDSEACLASIISHIDLSGKTLLATTEMARLAELCQRHNVAAGCGLLGLAYLHGWAGLQNIKEALILWQSACDGGFRAACLASAITYEVGWAGAKNAGLAKQFYEKACAGRDGASCTALLTEEAPRRQTDADRTLLGRRVSECKDGKSASCLQAALLDESVRDLKRPSERTQTLSYYHQACTGMLYEACLRGGLLAYWASQLPSATEERSPRRSGRKDECRHDPARCSGTPPGQNLALGREQNESVKLMECNNGDICLRLGRVFRDGGVGSAQRNLQAAAAAFKRGCEMNNGESCFSFGKLLREGQGVPQDQVAGNHLISRACSYGHQPACELPIKEMEHECNQGRAAYCVAVGQRLLNGEGITKDPQRGLALLLKGCKQQNLPGCELLDQHSQ